MRILGLSFDYHDSAAALVLDGAVVSAIQEERLSPVKHDMRFPWRALKHCFAAGSVAAHELDAVVFYENLFRRFERIARSSLLRSPRWLGATFRDWIAQGKVEVVHRIGNARGLATSRVVFSDHHAAHAVAAFFCSPFEQATIVTVDGVGEFETASISVGRGNTIKWLSSLRFSHSIGLAI